MKKIILPVLSLLVVLVFFETGLSVFWKMSALRGELFRTSDNARLRYELVPESSLDGPVPIRINRDGFRDHEYSRSKPEGVKRLLVLGDSETFSRHLPLEETLPKQIEMRLNTPEAPIRYQVLNLGVIGYTTIQELELLKVKGLAYEPDAVLLLYVLNDPDEGEFYFKKNFLLRRSITARYVAYRLKKGKIIRDRKHLGIKTLSDHYRYLHSGLPWEGVRDSLMEMADLCAVRGIPLVLVINPELSDEVRDFDTGYPFRDIHQKLEALSHKNLFVFDPTEAFALDGRPVSDYRHSAEDSHKNVSGHALLAAFIRNILLERGIL